MNANQEILKTKNLSIGYKNRSSGKSVLARDLNLSLNPGEFVCMIGANGTGKSTLMRTIAGVQPALAGELLLNGSPIHKLKARQIALKLSLVLTEGINVGNLSVYTLVSLGRNPHTGWLGNLSPEDEKVIAWALEVTETTQYIHRNIDQISDGEKQKVMIARALAQDTPLILLDEPTAHLDLPNRVMIFKLLRRLAQETQKAILLTTHTLDLALQAADQIWLIRQKPETKLREILTGAPEDLVLSGTFEQAFHREGLFFDKHTGTFTMAAPKPRKVRLLGEGIQAFWTKRALEREGFSITNNGEAVCDIKLHNTSGDNYRWTIGGQNQSYTSVGQLLQALRQIAQTKK